MNLLEIPFGEVDKFNAVVEVPHGSPSKYEYDEAVQAFALNFTLGDSVTFPFNYGFIPQTKGGDNDPLDVMILATYPLKQGSIVEAKPLGFLEMTDRGEDDYKIIAVPVVDPKALEWDDLEDLSDDILDSIAHFWLAIASQKNKVIKIIDFHNRSSAIKEIKKALL